MRHTACVREQVLARCSPNAGLRARAHKSLRTCTRKRTYAGALMHRCTHGHEHSNTRKQIYAGEVT